MIKIKSLTAIVAIIISTCCLISSSVESCLLTRAQAMALIQEIQGKFPDLIPRNNQLPYGGGLGPNGLPNYNGQFQPGFNGQPNFNGQFQPGFNGQPNYSGQQQPNFNGMPNYNNQPPFNGQQGFNQNGQYPGYNQNPNQLPYTQMTRDGSAANNQPNAQGTPNIPKK